MANSEDIDEVFDFSTNEFTREDLVNALHDMVNEYRKLSQSFDEVKAEKASLTDKSSENGCMKQNELDGRKMKLELLVTENEELRRTVQATIDENQKLLKTVNAWNQSSVSLKELHEKQKQAADKTGIGYSNYDCNSIEPSTQPQLKKGKFNYINFVRSSTVYEHDEPNVQSLQKHFMETRLNIKDWDTLNLRVIRPEGLDRKQERSNTEMYTTGLGKIHFHPGLILKRLDKNHTLTVRQFKRDMF